MTAENIRPWQGAADANGDADDCTVKLNTDKIASNELLLPEHRQMLAAAGIPIDFAVSLRVRSVSDAAELPDSLRHHAFRHSLHNQ